MTTIERAIPVGGAALNFTVVGGTTEPASPKENTIWVNTGTILGEWQFANAQPTTRADGTDLVAGDVWFKTGAVDSAEFNALKKNGVYLCPNYIYQWDGSTFTQVTGQIYKGGEWVDISGAIVFYSNGTTYVEWASNQGTETGTYLAFTGTTDVSNGVNGNRSATTTIFDITPFKTLSMVYGGDNSICISAMLYVYTASGTLLASKNTGTNYVKPAGEFFALDVTDLTGDVYVLFTNVPGNLCGSRTGRLYDLRIE